MYKQNEAKSRILVRVVEQSTLGSVGRPRQGGVVNEVVLDKSVEFHHEEDQGGRNYNKKA